jgi:UDP-2,3-diacylglucosamine pyrophosphatase LpxH
LPLPEKGGIVEWVDFANLKDANGKVYMFTKPVRGSMTKERFDRISDLISVDNLMSKLSSADLVLYAEDLKEFKQEIEQRKKEKFPIAESLLQRMIKLRLLKKAKSFETDAARREMIDQEIESLKIRPEAMRQFKILMQRFNGLGVVHNDLHEGNVLLDEEDNFWLFDFGIALSANEYSNREEFVENVIERDIEEGMNELERNILSFEAWTEEPYATYSALFDLMNKRDWPSVIALMEFAKSRETTAEMLLSMSESKDVKDADIVMDGLEMSVLNEHAVERDGEGNPIKDEDGNFLIERTGGDISFVEQLSRDEILIVHGDSIGHGLTAAATKAMVNKLLSEIMGEVKEPAKILERLNNEIYKINQAQPNLLAGGSFSITILNTMTGEGRVAFAGLSPKIVTKEKGVYDLTDEIDISNRVTLGFKKDLKYTEAEIKLEDGDYYIAYSDGLTEQKDEKGEQFSEEALNDRISMSRGKAAADIINDVWKEVFDVFAKDRAQADDASMMVIEKVSAPSVQVSKETIDEYLNTHKRLEKKVADEVSENLEEDHNVDKDDAKKLGKSSRKYCTTCPADKKEVIDGFMDKMEEIFGQIKDPADRPTEGQMMAMAQAMYTFQEEELWAALEIYTKSIMDGKITRNEMETLRYAKNRLNQYLKRDGILYEEEARKLFKDLSGHLVAAEIEWLNEKIASATKPYTPKEYKNFKNVVVIENAPSVAAIGDIHGAYKETVQALFNAGVIDKNLNWIGGDKHIVFMGDYIDRGVEKDGAKNVLDLVMKLIPQAAKAGGKIIALRGNHEDMLLDALDEYEGKIIPRSERDWTKDAASTWWNQGGKETAASFVYTTGLSDEQAFEKFRDYMLNTKDGKRYLNWIKARPYAAKINDYFFSHAGPYLEAEDLEDLEFTLRDPGMKSFVMRELVWGRHWEAAYETDDDGKLKTDKRGYPIRIGPNLRAEEFLQRMGASAFVSGHTPTISGQIEVHMSSKNVPYAYTVDDAATPYYAKRTAKPGHGLLMIDNDEGVRSVYGSKYKTPETYQTGEVLTIEPRFDTEKYKKQLEGKVEEAKQIEKLSTVSLEGLPSEGEEFTVILGGKPVVMKVLEYRDDKVLLENTETLKRSKPMPIKVFRKFVEKVDVEVKAPTATTLASLLNGPAGIAALIGRGIDWLRNAIWPKAPEEPVVEPVVKPKVAVKPVAKPKPVVKPKVAVKPTVELPAVGKTIEIPVKGEPGVVQIYRIVDYTEEFVNLKRIPDNRKSRAKKDAIIRILSLQKAQTDVEKGTENFLIGNNKQHECSSCLVLIRQIREFINEGNIMAAYNLLEAHRDGNKIVYHTEKGIIQISDEEFISAARSLRAALVELQPYVKGEKVGAFELKKNIEELIAAAEETQTSARIKRIREGITTLPKGFIRVSDELIEETGIPENTLAKLIQDNIPGEEDYCYGGGSILCIKTSEENVESAIEKIFTEVAEKTKPSEAVKEEVELALEDIIRETKREEVLEPVPGLKPIDEEAMVVLRQYAENIDFEGDADKLAAAFKDISLFLADRDKLSEEQIDELLNIRKKSVGVDLGYEVDKEMDEDRVKGFKRGPGMIEYMLEKNKDSVIIALPRDADVMVRFLLETHPEKADDLESLLLSRDSMGHSVYNIIGNMKQKIKFDLEKKGVDVDNTREGYKALVENLKKEIAKIMELHEDAPLEDSLSEFVTLFEDLLYNKLEKSGAFEKERVVFMDTCCYTYPIFLEALTQYYSETIWNKKIETSSFFWGSFFNEPTGVVVPKYLEADVDATEDAIIYTRVDEYGDVDNPQYVMTDPYENVESFFTDLELHNIIVDIKKSKKIEPVKVAIETVTEEPVKVKVLTEEEAIEKGIITEDDDTVVLMDPLVNSLEDAIEENAGEIKEKIEEMTPEADRCELGSIRCTNANEESVEKAVKILVNKKKTVDTLMDAKKEVVADILAKARRGESTLIEVSLPGHIGKPITMRLNVKSLVYGDLKYDAEKGYYLEIAPFSDHEEGAIVGGTILPVVLDEKTGEFIVDMAPYAKFGKSFWTRRTIKRAKIPLSGKSTLFMLTEPLKNIRDGKEYYVFNRFVKKLDDSVGFASYSYNNGLESAGFAFFKQEGKTLEENIEIMYDEIEKRFPHVSRKDIPSLTKEITSSSFPARSLKEEGWTSGTPLMPFSIDPSSPITVVEEQHDYAIIEAEVPAEKVFFTIDKQGKEIPGWEKTLQDRLNRGEEIIFVQTPDPFESEFITAVPFLPTEYITRIHTEENLR